MSKWSASVMARSGLPEEPERRPDLAVEDVIDFDSVNESGNPYEYVRRRERCELAHRILLALNRREREVVRRRYGIAYGIGSQRTLVDVGIELGLTGSGAQVTEAKALRKMRKRILACAIAKP